MEHIGVVGGLIEVTLDEEAALDTLDWYQSFYGHHDQATKELAEAIERAYPPESQED